MAFEKHARPVPTSLGRIDFMFWTGETGDPLHAEYRIIVRDADGKAIGQQTGNLLSHMSPTEITQMTNFINSKRTKAATEILAP